MKISFLFFAFTILKFLGVLHARGVDINVYSPVSTSGLKLQQAIHWPKIVPDPELVLKASDIIRRWDYPVEEHEAVTDDGYVLTVLRIPRGRNQNATSTVPRPVVFFQHGIESSCIDWIVNLPNQSAGYIYADRGFDVWMGNFRGNPYSLRHVNMTSKEPDFWKFSWDEMARYDLPAMIDLVLKVTNASSVYYVGHSMGTTTAFAQLSQDENFAKKVKKFYALAPVATVTNIKGPFHLVARFTRFFEYILNLIGVEDVLPTTRIQQQLAEYLCGNVITDFICKSLLMTLAGPESQQLNYTRLPVYLAHTPAGTSTHTLTHFAQMITMKKFQKFDYGSVAKNRQNYGQATPPLYDIDRVKTPVVLYWGAMDWLADPRDVEELTPRLRYLAGSVYFPKYNHIDFIWGQNAALDIYLPILKDIKYDYTFEN